VRSSKRRLSSDTPLIPIGKFLQRTGQPTLEECKPVLDEGGRWHIVICVSQRNSQTLRVATGQGTKGYA
jgi:hypothetical protein